MNADHACMLRASGSMSGASGSMSGASGSMPGASGSMPGASGSEVSECRCPTQTASILSQSCKFRFQSCKFRFLKSNSTFTTTYGRQPLAVACSCSRVGRLAVARRGGGVHHGDGDGQAVVQEKGAALAAPPAWEKHTEEQASIMAWCGVSSGVPAALTPPWGAGRIF